MKPDSSHLYRHSSSIYGLHVDRMATLHNDAGSERRSTSHDPLRVMTHDPFDPGLVVDEVVHDDFQVDEFMRQNRSSEGCWMIPQHPD